MNFKINEDNQMTIDPSQGSRITQLILGGKKVIKLVEPQTFFLASGSFLMFPWVSRITENPYEKIVKFPFGDQKSYPLHGLFGNTQREIKVEEIKQNDKLTKIKIHSQNKNVHKQIHSFIQTLTLNQNQLQIDFTVLINKQDQHPYCFGYHPYLELSKPLSELKIETNLKKQIQLENDLLIKWPISYNDWKGQLDGKEFYDSLFQGEQFNQEKLNNFVSLNDGINTLKIQSNLSYWQIYTPDDKKRIAIEPMSFHGGIYQIIKKHPQLRQKLPQTGKIRISIN